MLEIVTGPAPRRIAIEINGVRASVQGMGLYDFNRNRSRVAVFSGSLRLSRGDKHVVLGSGLGAKTRTLRTFRVTPETGNLLYAWSDRRSRQLSLESAACAQSYSAPPRDWHGPVWHWDPWSASYTLLSASGFLNSPFGWPFYAPGHSHNYIPAYPGGDSYLYGPPVLSPNPGVVAPLPPVNQSWPSVPLTAPGVPSFPSSRGVGPP